MTNIKNFSNLYVYNFKILILILIYLSFVSGFTLNEDSSGGGFIDLKHIYKNFLLFKQNTLFQIPWDQYESTALPLYYLISSFFLKGTNPEILKIFNIPITILSVIFFFKIIKCKYKGISSLDANLFSSLLLLSPYFRTTSFWGLEENIGILFLLICLFFFININNKKNIDYKLFFCIFFCCLTFYTRQNYVFLLVLVYFSLLDIYKIFTKFNYFITILFTIFLVPSLFFFIIWNGIVPPGAQDLQRASLNFYNLPIILSIILVYIFPFFLLKIIDKKIVINQKKIIFFSILFLVYYFLFINFSFPGHNIGNGLILKIFYIFKNYAIFNKSLFLLISFLTIILIYECFKNNHLLIFFITLNILIYLNIDIVFHEYFDPLFTIFFLVFSKIKLSQINFFSIVLPLYFSIFLAGSIFYH